MKRPLVVTLFALFYMLWMAFTLLVLVTVTQPRAFPIGRIVGPRALEVALEMTVHRSHRRYDQRLGMQTVDGVGAALLLFHALELALIGIGLWFLCKWGRWLALVSNVYWLGRWIIAAMIFGSFSLHAHSELANPLGPAFVAVGLIRAAVIWYLLQPDIKQAFGEAQGAGRAF